MGCAVISEHDYISDAVDIGIPYDKDHMFYSWNDKVYFTATMRGDTLDTHIAAKGKNKRFLRIAIRDFCMYAFDKYKWCTKIAACVKLKSVKNLLIKCGFTSLAIIDECEVFAIWAK